MSNVGRPGGVHGGLTEANPVLIFSGAGVRRGATVDAARTIDIVPTLLHSVGVAPAVTVDGRVIAGVLLPLSDD